MQQVLGSSLSATAREFRHLNKETRKKMVKSAALICGARLVLVPLLNGAAVLGLEYLMGRPLERVMKFILLVEGATPTAMTLMNICSMYGRGEKVVTTALLLQYVFSSITLTFFVGLTLYIV